MRNIAVVEDDAGYRETFREYIKRYCEDKEEQFNITFFAEKTSFLREYNMEFDIVFMDIRLPDGNGMEAIRSIRKTDKNTLIIFVTDLAKYAVKGYEVDAFDFIVKPFNYFTFSMKLDRAMERLKLYSNHYIWVKIQNGKKKIRIDSLKYVEVALHVLIFHTTEGDIKTSGSMKSALELLKKEPFELCNQCYLVNLAYVTEVRDFSVMVGTDELQISHLKKKGFVSQLNKYLSGDWGK